MFPLDGNPQSVTDELPESPMPPFALQPTIDDVTITGAFPSQVCAFMLRLKNDVHKITSKKLLIKIKLKVNKLSRIMD
jgi:hypothetical protein